MLSITSSKRREVQKRGPNEPAYDICQRPSKRLHSKWKLGWTYSDRWRNADHLPSEWQEFIEAYRSFDKASHRGVHLISCPLALNHDLFSVLDNLKDEASDLRLLGLAASKGMQRALQSGIQRPCLQVALEDFDLARLESACFAAMSALWVPLEARELAKGGSIEALGIVSGSLVELQSTAQKDTWSRWLNAIEHGRIVARDICGTEPERMSPPKLAELCKKVFRGTNVKLEIVKDRRILIKNILYFQLLREPPGL